MPNKLAFKASGIFTDTTTIDFEDEIVNYAIGIHRFGFGWVKKNVIRENLMVKLSNNLVNNNKSIQVTLDVSSTGTDTSKTNCIVTALAFTGTEIIDEEFLFLSNQSGIRVGGQGVKIDTRLHGDLLLYPFVSGFNIMFADQKPHKIRSFRLSTEAKQADQGGNIVLNGNAYFENGAISDGTIDVGIFAIQSDKTMPGFEIKQESKKYKFKGEGEYVELSFSSKVQSAAALTQIVKIENADQKHYKLNNMWTGKENVPSFPHTNMIKTSNTHVSYPCFNGYTAEPYEYFETDDDITILGLAALKQSSSKFTDEKTIHPPIMVKSGVNSWGRLTQRKTGDTGWSKNLTTAVESFYEGG